MTPVSTVADVRRPLPSLPRPMPYAYQIFGLTLHADFDCPELLAAAADAPPDIEVRLDTLDASLDDANVAREHETTPGIYQFQIQGIARYRVEQGRSIRVQPESSADPGDVRLWLLGTALGVLLHQRGLLPLHVSAVALDGGAQAFCGESGAGKSTLAAALHRRGLPLLTDDVGLAVPETDCTTFYPGFPRIKLWRDALAHFGMDHRPLTPDLTRNDKYHLRLAGEDGFHVQPLPLRRLYLLERADEDATPCIEPVRGHASIGLIRSNTYRAGLVRRLGQAGAHLRQCGRVASSIRVYRFVRPWHLDRLDETLEHLLAHMNQPE